VKAGPARWLAEREVWRRPHGEGANVLRKPRRSGITSEEPEALCEALRCGCGGEG
jgi:hypothetical protein